MKSALALSLLAALLLVACGESDRNYTIDEVRTDRAPQIPKGPGPMDRQRLFLGQRPGSNPHGPGGPGGSMPGGSSMGGAPKFEWDLPDGWKTLPPKQFRDANFTLARDSAVECFLTVMAGGGGGLERNLTRWRGQMGQAAMSAAEVKALPTVAMLSREAILIELSGTFSGKNDYGFLAAYLEQPGQTLTLKMTGPAALVAEEKDNFLKLAASLRVDATHGSAGPHGGAQSRTPTGSDGIGSGMATGKSGFVWDTPNGWTAGRERNMRIVTLHPEGSKDAQCYVSMFNGDGGGLDLNVNRWLDQVGGAQLKSAEIAKLPTIDMLGAKGVQVESFGNFSGMGGADAKGAGLLGVICMLDGRAMFVKFIGPADLVKREKDNFLAFSRSLRPEK